MADREQVKKWMGPDVEEGMDTARGLSSSLLRVNDHGVVKIGLGGEADVNDHINALLDLLALHHYEVTHGKKPDNVVQLIIGRGAHTEAALPPLRTLRRTHAGSPRIELRVESESTEGLLETDDGEAPSFDGKSPTQYAQYLMDWYAKEPMGLALEVLARSPDAERLRLYPQLSKSVATGRWSLRIDGLQVGEVSATEGTLQVGGGQESSSKKVVKEWRKISNSQKGIPFNGDSVDHAVDLIHQLVERLEVKSGGLLDNGVPEHALESAVVRGDITVAIGGRRLIPIGHDQSMVAYGSQIPTQWTPGEPPRPLDALLRDGRVPWAVEMKVGKASGGYGAYLRKAIGQAVLYRHFLRAAPPYEHWFEARGLDRQAVRAAVVYPQPTEEVQRKIAVRIGNLLLTAAAFDVQVATVDAGWLK